ncbi:5'-nucleotidase SurE [Poriferisphaera corsica]|uniref:5'-nucleotidase SurE n=1 Tax=Poriferisphaera corsica TaxID=2528020 RepID=A0A517YTW9_9BACT|nr:5'/3'-nucleotidase SurE [Poriferisphaera corsica]QDU33668.1 5'-nucleotidase SurE [Poriferisphaera corsica]
MRILLTNDDGIEAPGLIALYNAIKDLGDILVVAPATVQSATSHAVTFHKPVPVEHKTYPDFTGYAVHGRPADCVKLAVEAISDKPIDLVISGMNAGANIGINVIYSGTVAAAREAAFEGIPAIAVSLHIGDFDNIRWEQAAIHAREAIKLVIDGPRDAHSVININIPILDSGDPPVGIKAVPISHAPMITRYKSDSDPDGHETYAVHNAMEFSRIDPDTDVDAIFQRYTTITPLHFELTHLKQLNHWQAHIAAHKSGIPSRIG